MQQILKAFKNLLSRRLFIVLLILGQIALIVVAILEYGKLLWLSDLLTLVSVLTALHLLLRNDKSAFKLSLVFLILLFPLFGGALYWIMHLQTSDIGYRKKLRTIEHQMRLSTSVCESDIEQAEEKIPESKRLAHYLKDVAGFPLYHNTDTCYFPTGAEMLESMLKDIRNAKHYIFLEYFIIEEGEMWDSILSLLIQKAEEGVDVRLIYDDIGCFLTLPPKYDIKLRESGIKCKVFNKVHPFLSTSHNNRDHKKILSIDGIIAYTGGMNLADEYINKKIKYGHWKDNAIRLYGTGAWSLTTMFLHMWNLLSFHEQEEIEKFLPLVFPTIQKEGFVQPFNDTPIDRENVCEHVYMRIIENAQNYLYIITPYLMVDSDMLSTLKIAAKSGVDVRIITPNIPDKKLVHFTTRSYYRELIETGVRIYEYTDGFVHAKTFLSDDTVATVGTANLDFRSLYFHFECGTCLYRTDSIADIKADFLQTLERCHMITEKDYKKNIVVRFFQSICRVFAPLM